MEILMLFVVCVLLAVGVFEAYLRVKEREEAIKHINQLVDRVLAPDFNTYKVHEANVEAAKAKKVEITDEQIYKLQEAQDSYPV